MAVTINPITREALGAIRDIAEQQLGCGYVNTSDLLAPNNIVCYAAFDDKVVGFYIAGTLPLEAVYQRFTGLQEKGLAYLEDVDNVGMVSSVATHPEYTGQGIGSALVRHCVAALERKGSKVVVASAWKSHQGVHIGSILMKQGFEEVMLIDDFWKQDSLVRHYKCPVCGDPPCRCKAVLYVRHKR
jgi:ribosomal protein S18 acetylase RimI-like enzyme